MKPEKKRLLILMAMEDESRELVARLALQPFVSAANGRLPFRYYAGELNNVEILLSVSGKHALYHVDNIGLESAAIQAFASISEFMPTVVINAGTAGSFSSKGARVGDAYQSERYFVFHDHRIPLRNFGPLGEGKYPCCDTSGLAKELGLKLGIVSSGSSLDYTEKDLEIFHSLGATLKEMEAGAIAYVCHLLNARFFALKTVTNLLDENPNSAEEFEKNLVVAVRVLTHQMVRLLEVLTQDPQRLNDL
jgi:nucleoside phosphorylase